LCIPWNISERFSHLISLESARWGQCKQEWRDLQIRSLVHLNTSQNIVFLRHQNILVFLFSWEIKCNSNVCLPSSVNKHLFLDLWNSQKMKHKTWGRKLCHAVRPFLRKKKENWQKVMHEKKFVSVIKAL
jgi:hypothetical protein